MYLRYSRSQDVVGKVEYRFLNQISLFGCNKGFIPRLLGKTLQSHPTQGEPFKWHIDVIADLENDSDYPKSTLLIDLKPKQNKSNLSLYELMDVWGYSSYGWTPILLRLNGLFVDQDPSGFNRESFSRNNSEIHKDIYEFLYLDGSVSEGKLTGRWVPPPASPTNAALLWPAVLKYFVECIREKTPKVLQT